MFHLEEIFMRDQPKVTLTEVKQGKYHKYSFYKNTLVLSNNSALIDSLGRVLCRLFKDVIPEEMIKHLELSAAAFLSFVHKYAIVNDIRGNHITVKLGSYIEQGVSGKICISKWNEILEKFIINNSAL